MYTNKINAIVQYGTAAEVDLASTGVAGISWLVMSPIVVARLVATVSTVLSSTANAVLTYRLRPTFGSSGGQSTIGTLKVGTTGGVGAVGSAFYKDITPVRVSPGSQIVVDVTTAVTTSGKCVACWEGSEDAEYAPNKSSMVAG